MLMLSRSCLALLAALSAPMPALSKEISSPADLLQALRAAKGGETFELKAGEYSLVLNGHQDSQVAGYSQPVVITSADPAKPATFTDINVIQVTNLTFKNVVFDYTFRVGEERYYSPFYFETVKGLTLSSLLIDGDKARDTGTYADGYGNAYGVNLVSCKDVRIENSLIRNFFAGLFLDAVDNLAVVGNEITAMRSEGMDVIAVRKGLIERNYIHDFVTAPDSPDHQDFIQLWTAEKNVASSDVTIRDNILDSGGKTWTESIFMRNEEVDMGRAGPEMFYKNIEVSGNLIRNNHLHGITVGEVDGLKITNNTILQAREVTDGSGLLYVPQINVSTRSLNVEITNNIVPEPPNFGGPLGRQWVVKNNAVVQRHKESGNSSYNGVFVNALVEDAVSVDELQVLPWKTVVPKGVGSPYSKFNEKPKTPRAIITSRSKAGGTRQLFKFSIEALYGPDGKIETPIKTVEWTMNGSDKLEGKAVEYSFKSSGVQLAEAIVTLQDGTVVRARRAVKAR
jgi:hypothetical protein